MSRARDLANVADDVSTGTVVTTESPSLGRRNLIINGGFDVWQRSTDETGTFFTYVTADRWRHYNGSMSMRSYRVDVSSDSAVPTQYAIGLEVSPDNWGLQHRVEYVKAGTYTLSFYIKASTSGSLKLYDSADSVSITTDWQRVSKTLTVSSSGQFDTFVVNNTSQTLNGTVFITGVQLEVGDTATPFEHRSYGEELALCQRYYQELGGVLDASIASGMSTSGSVARFVIKYATVMRTAPTFSGTDFFVTDNSTYNAVVSSLGFIQTSNNSARLQLNTNNVMTQYRPAFLNPDTSAGTLKLDAEL